jgi:type II secretory pathway component PulL
LTTKVDKNAVLQAQTLKNAKQTKRKNQEFWREIAPQSRQNIL